ncbi:hypothetical protein CK501_15650 [Halovibrio salipaludis]|uniref:FlgD Ig-like domain-containing protein n=1 Tax=Halovibrio salipaludis TaxID=2032626 RepID=A0A2A2EX95_9GAMM|nr:hypothetical protein [Halovibrio salipaludis]PAU76999.1 hypothetical protein CK501_15650 [Halovibrio salipaludis]
MVLALGISGNAIGAEIGAYGQRAFNPSAGESFEIPVIADQAGTLKLEIRSPDRDVVRVLEERIEEDEVGQTVPITWDGRDLKGKIVPDEAYTPVLRMNGKVVNNPYEYSGGEVIERIEPDFSSHGKIGFQLEHPSRVLIRAGIEAGPLMRTLVNWQPRVSGKNIVHWDGYDEDGVINLRNNPDVRLLLTGYRLPEHSVITSGSDKEYLEWRSQYDWPDRMPDSSEVALERNGERLSRHFFLAQSVEREPEVLVTVDGQPVEKGAIDVDGRFTATVDLEQADQWAMDQSQYEIAFFIDGEFVAEEEQGYVPFKWLWDADGLAPGKHTLTVNVSSFNGAVGVRTLELNVPDE